jgi:hypothetical protein
MKNASYAFALLIWTLSLVGLYKRVKTVSSKTSVQSPIMLQWLKNTLNGNTRMSEYRVDWHYAILRFDVKQPKGSVEHCTDNLEEASKYMTALREKALDESSEFYRLGSRFELFERISI